MCIFSQEQWVGVNPTEHARTCQFTTAMLSYPVLPFGFGQSQIRRGLVPLTAIINNQVSVAFQLALQRVAWPSPWMTLPLGDAIQYAKLFQAKPWGLGKWSVNLWCSVQQTIPFELPLPKTTRMTILAVDGNVVTNLQPKLIVIFHGHSRLTSDVVMLTGKQGNHYWSWGGNDLRQRVRLFKGCHLIEKTPYPTVWWAS